MTVLPEPALPSRPPETLSVSAKNVTLRAPWEMTLKTIFLLQMGFGSLANVLLFFHSISPLLFGHKQRPTDKILTHIVTANLLVLLSSGMPHTMAAFVWRKPLSSLGCKCVYYLQRVARSTTLCSTCVLSTCQFFTLIPRKVEWMMLRRRASKFIGPSCCTCWVFGLLLNIYVPVKLTGPQDVGNDTNIEGKWFCSSSSSFAGIVILWSFPDAAFLGVMVWSSGSMLLLLHRHHQRVQYIHTPTGHQQCPPETRAAHTILMLVVTFVIFYVLDSTFTFYITAFLDSRLWLMQSCNVLTSCFPSVCPFLLLLRNPRSPRICS
uniref:Vomeronasal type-1 receptor n=1 Tax=Sus scrofa TaxID=9823 RepID=A0A8D1S631_PIG